MGQANRFEQARDTKSGEFAGEHRQLKRRWNKALRSEVVDLVRLESFHDRKQRCLVEEVGTRHLNVIAQMLDATSSKGTRAPRDAHDLIAEPKQVFGKITPVLPCYARDQRGGHLSSWSVAPSTRVL